MTMVLRCILPPPRSKSSLAVPTDAGARGPLSAPGMQYVIYAHSLPDGLAQYTIAPDGIVLTLPFHTLFHLLLGTFNHPCHS